MKIEYTPEQLAPINALKRGSKLVIVRGEAGVGKSVVGRKARDDYPNSLVVSSLGIAAQNAGGVTTFSAFGIPTFYPINPSLRDAKNARRRDPYAKNFNRTNKKDCDFPFEPVKHGPIRAAGLLVLDEAFFNRCDHLDFIDKTCRQARKRPMEPFGGLQVLMVGDEGQGCPIVDDSHRKQLEDWGYEFPFDITQSKVLKDNACEEFNLTKIFRQDEAIDGMRLSRFRSGNETNEDIDVINGLVSETVPLGATILTPFVAKAQKANDEELRNVMTPEMTFEATMKGTYKKMDEKKLPFPSVIKVRPTCRVIIKRNEKKKVEGDMQKVVNGDQGVFIGMTPKGKMVIDLDRGIQVQIGKVVTYDGIKVEKKEICLDPDAPKEEQEYIEREEIVSNKANRYEQYPIKLGYAITISASQGMTIPKVHIDLGRGLWDEAYGLFYTAMSRVSGGFRNLTISRKITRKDNKVSPLLIRNNGEQYELL